MMNPSELVNYKENIQPLRHGRDASKLCAGLQAQNDAEMDKALQAQRLEYENLLRDDSVEDPISVWYEYVYWLEQTFPSHAHKSKIHNIIKKCINKFKENEEYKNDERFVKLCLKYATMTSSPLDTLKQVYGNGIGVKCAIFYIAWAEQFAISNSFTHAAKVYEKGINRLAQPIEMLKAAQTKFDAFIARRVLDAGLVFEPNAEVYETGPVRQAYNKIKPLSVRGAEVVPSVRVGENVAPAGRYKAQLTAPQKTAGFAIYQDGDENDGLQAQAAVKMPKFKSEAALTKENVKKAGKWTNPETKNVPFSVPAVALPFQVHVDDEAASQPAVVPSVPLTSALKTRQNDEFNDDFMNTPLFICEQYDPTVRPMYRKEQVYAGGMEFQFEELRAIQYRRRMPEMARATPALVSSTTKVKVKPTEVQNNATENAFATPAPAVKADQTEKKKGLSIKGTPLATPLCASAAVSSSTEALVVQEDDVSRRLSGQPQPSSSKPRLVSDSGRKSLKVKTSEEARSARRRIALGGAGDESERRTHSARKSNFGGVVRRTLDLDQKEASAKPELPSDSFINQTIHTKEAVDVMQELWFAKPASPPKAAVVPPQLAATPAVPATSAFNFYVDESCLDKIPEEPSSARGGAENKPSRKGLALALCVAEDDNKENAAPASYDGPSGRSTRPVTGILTPSENVPFQPIQEQQEDEEEEEEESAAEMPGNMTGITENFTQAFTFQRITHASTPNMRRSLYRPPTTHEDSLNDGDSENVCPTQEQMPIDLKMAGSASVAAAALTTQPQDYSQAQQKDVNTDSRRSLFRAPMTEQRTIGDKNLSIIVETSREYKSSSSGSGASNYCSKLLPFTPGPGESRLDGRRLNSYSQADDLRKTPFAYKTQSTYGYEASGELSCTSTKPSHEDVMRQVTDRLAACNSDDSYKTDDVPSRTSAAQHILSPPAQSSKPKAGEVKRMTLAATSFQLGDSWIVNKTADMDIDPFDSKLTDALLERTNFPTNHHVPGCNFVFQSKLPALKISSTVRLGNGQWELKKLLGEGAYAKVFRAQNTSTGETKVLKYQKPAFPWEFYIAREIRARCSSSEMSTFFMNIEEGYFYENASLLMSCPVEYGDLLSAINLYKQNQGKPMSDYLALYFSVQILEIIQTLHSFQIIHGDVKPDNFLLKKLNGKLCLELIDFGRSIDMTHFPDGTSFTRVVTTEGLTCVEMQTGKNWTYQIDWFGVAGCVHCLLFGDYMKVQQKGSIWQISKNIPRYLAKSGWKELFEALLNIRSCTEMPDISQLRSMMAAKLESYGTQPDLIKLSNFLDNH